MTRLRLTEQEIDAARTEAGGWTRKTLAGWGVSWPPRRGWKRKLLGLKVPDRQHVAAPIGGDESNPDGLEGKLLHLVVMAVINAGQNNILKGIDELNAYYESELPTVADVIGGRPGNAIIDGGIRFDDRVYSFTVARLVGDKCDAV